MAWTTPRTWVAGEVPGDTIFNTHVRDNLNYLIARPSSSIKRDNNATYTTTSATFVDIDSANLSITLNISGSAVLVSFCGLCTGNNNLFAFFDITVDGVRVGAAGADGIAGFFIGGNNALASFAVLVTGLAAGTHTFKVQWKYGAGSTATNLGLYAGNNLGGSDVIPVFSVVEVG